MTFAAPPAEGAPASTPGPLTWPAERFMGRASALKLGMWIFLLSRRVFVRRAAHHLRRPARAAAVAGGSAGEPALGINFTAGLTFLLICSSVTMVLAVAAAARGQAADRPPATWR